MERTTGRIDDNVPFPSPVLESHGHKGKAQRKGPRTVLKKTVRFPLRGDESREVNYAEFWLSSRQDITEGTTCRFGDNVPLWVAY